MTNQFAVLFPGQGSQSVGMMNTYAENSIVRDLFNTASDCLGYDLWALVATDTKAQLNQTTYTQPALLAADVAAWRVFFTESHLRPKAVAGHSLGEYAALVCAGVISFEDALKLVAMRGQLMQEAVPEGQGAMAAIVGLSDDAVDKVCIDAADSGDVSAANYNSVGQVVIAGQTTAVEKAIVLAKAAGARIAKKIPVSVPSHCALMQPAADKMRAVLESVSMSSPLYPVFLNVSAEAPSDVETIRQSLIEQLISPVQWVKTIRAIADLGISRFFECGPGAVLTGLNKRIDKTFDTQPLKDFEAIQAALAMLKEEV